MLLECVYCEAVVDAEVLKTYDAQAEEGYMVRYGFCRCPKCESPLLTVDENVGNGFVDPIRIYPPREKSVSYSFPTPIRNSYNEALCCMKGKAFTASTIMCRKTLEGICVVHGITEKNLAHSLKRMKESGIIDSRLFEWAEALRISGNEAAHGVHTTISAQDAKDIMEFTNALLEYVFTFREKFDEFKKRREQHTKAKKIPPAPNNKK